MFFGGASYPAAGKKRPYVHHFPPIQRPSVQNPRGAYGPRRHYNVISHRIPGMGGTPAFYSLLQDPSSVTSPYMSPVTPGFPAHASLETAIRCVNIVREVYRLLKIRQDPTGGNHANRAFSMGAANGYGALTANLLASAVQYLNQIQGANSLLPFLLNDLDTLIHNGVKTNGSPLVPGPFVTYYDNALAGAPLGPPSRTDFTAWKEFTHHRILSDTAMWGPNSSTVVAEPILGNPLVAGPGVTAQTARLYNYYRFPANVINI